MYIMYVDESGDPGPYNGKDDGNSRHFILSGLIIPIKAWNESFRQLKDSRRRIRQSYGLAMREELHAAELVRINKIIAYRQIKKADRIAILISFLREMPSILAYAKVINICLDKEKIAKKDGDSPDSKIHARDIDSPDPKIKTLAWSRLIQRFDNFLKKADGSQGILVADGMEDTEIRALLRKMRVYNWMPSHYGKPYNRPVEHVIEDPFHRDSKHSYFTQAADVIAHSLYRMEYPKGSLQKFGLDRGFRYLEPILLKEASSGDPLGIVRK